MGGEGIGAPTSVGVIPPPYKLFLIVTVYKQGSLQFLKKLKWAVKELNPQPIECKSIALTN